VRKVKIIVSNPVAPDPRVSKEASSLARLGYEVRVLAWDRSGRFPRFQKQDGWTIERLYCKGRFGRGLANLPSLLLFQIRLLLNLLANINQFDIIHSIDFDTVIPPLLTRFIFRNKRLIYDIADFYADMLLRVPKWICKIIKLIDLWIIGRVDAIIIADESRIEQVKGSKPKKIVVINNSPNNDPSYYLNVTQALDSSRELRIFYAGLLSVERGLIDVLDIVAKNRSWQLDIAGFGADEEIIAKKARPLPNVNFYGRISYEKVLEHSARSDVLFALYDPKIPNHKYSSPNKLFEAMFLGKAIIVSKGTGMDDIVKKHDIGLVVEYGNSKQVEEAFRTVAMWNVNQREEYSRRAQRIFREKYSWSIMEERLKSLYDDIE